MTTIHTLFGKNGYLFLQNDSSNELGIHFSNRCNVQRQNIMQKNKNNFMIFVYPDKSIIYPNQLPDQYTGKKIYRPGLEIYKKILGDKVIDFYDFMQKHEDLYYHTDTHMNFKGSVLTFNYFIDIVNDRFGLKLNHKNPNVEMTVVDAMKFSDPDEKNSVPYHPGCGDLLAPCNIGTVVPPELTDNFYYTNDLYRLYPTYVIDESNKNYRIFKYANDITTSCIGKKLDWNMMSDDDVFVIFNDAYESNDSVLIFHDSFLINSFSLFINTFKTVIFSKSPYRKDLVDLYATTYVFEFRVERFLN